MSTISIGLYDEAKRSRDKYRQLRICDDVPTFEGWTYQWCHELALKIDNDQELLRKMRELVSNIMEMEYSRAWAIVDLKRGVWNKLEIDLDCSTQLDGWAELLEYYEAQVLEARLGV